MANNFTTGRTGVHPCSKAGDFLCMRKDTNIINEKPFSRDNETALLKLGCHPLNTKQITRFCC